jgi:hypothetical protein
MRKHFSFGPFEDQKLVTPIPIAFERYRTTDDPGDGKERDKKVKNQSIKP